VLVGDFEPENGVARSNGWMELYFDKAAELDETIKAQGEIVIFYDTTEGKRYINIQLTEFKDKWMDEPVTATYDYKEEEDLSGAFGFHLLYNLHEGDPDRSKLTKEEHLKVGVRWKASGAGRADVSAEGGDLDKGNPPLEKLANVECWDDLFIRVFFRQTAFPPTGDSYDFDMTGDSLLCHFKD